MTTAKIIGNITLDAGGINEMPVYVISFEKIYAKKLTSITAPQSTANWESGPNETKIVDLLRLETRFSVNGFVDSADESKLDNLIKAGGVINLLWNSVTYTCNFEKVSTLDTNQEEQDETKVLFTCIVGGNI